MEGAPLQLCTRAAYPKGFNIVEKGQAGNKFFIILYGVAQVTLEPVRIYERGQPVNNWIRSCRYTVTM
jgi:hypothetical protein